MLNENINVDQVDNVDDGDDDGGDELDILNLDRLGRYEFLNLMKKNRFGGDEKVDGYDIIVEDLQVVVKTSEEISNVSWKTFGTELYKKLSWCSNKSKKNHNVNDKTVLHKTSGYFPCGSMTLILGKPGSGKSSYLKSLSGNISYSGDINFKCNSSNSDDDDKLVGFGKSTKYVSESDTHLPVLTTRETLEFASTLFAKRNITKKYLETKVDLILNLLGLTKVENDFVGDGSIKGLSGGEIRRLSLGEALVGEFSVYLLDQISTGLDSATLIKLIQAISDMKSVFNQTVVMSLLQPPPEVFEQFDYIVLLDAGYTIYHGPRNEVLDYFAQLGYPCPENVDTSDFLVNIMGYSTTIQEDGASSLLVSDQQPPKTPQEFAECFKNSIYFHKTSGQTTKEEQTQVHAKKFFPLVHLFISRQFKATLRNKPIIKSRIVQNLIFGLLMGLLMFQVEYQEWFVKSMVFLQLIIFLCLTVLSVLPTIPLARKIFYKQTNKSLKTSVAFVLGDTIVGSLVNLIDAFVLGSFVYFMCGLSISDSGLPYATYLCIIISIGVCLSAIFRLVGYIIRSDEKARGFCVFLILIMGLFCGGLVTKEIIPVYFVWIFWINPLSYGYSSLMLNEYKSSKYTTSFPENTLDGKCAYYCQTGENCPLPYPNMNCGDFFLQARQVTTESWFLWFGIIYLWVFALLVVFLSGLVLWIRKDHSDSENQQKHNDNVNKKKNYNKCISKKEKEQCIVIPIGTMKSFGDDPSSNTQTEKYQTTKHVSILSFSNINYVVDQPSKNNKNNNTKKKQILSNVSGYAKPYELTALIGPSGSGKSTLLDILGNRKTNGKIEGKICIDGNEKVGEKMNSLVGYVEQFALHMPKSTVDELIRFRTRLKCIQDSNQLEHIELLELLELTHLRNALFEDLTIAQAKRLTIAVELASNPSILLLDEPTSGLESTAALHVITSLRNIASTGKTIICTIHQPSKKLFNHFDKVLLLHQGQVAYFGDLYNNQLTQHFENIPFVTEVFDDVNSNPATWVLEVMRDHEGEDFHEMFKSSTQYETMENEVANLSSCEKEIKSVVYSASLGKQFVELVKRACLQLWRTPDYTFFRQMIVGFVVPILLGTIFVGQTIKNAADIQSRVGLINILMLMGGNYPMQTRIGYVFKTRDVFFSEKIAKIYSPVIYTVANILCELPYVFFVSVFSVGLFYLLVGLTLDPITSPIYFLGMYILFQFTMLVFGNCLAHILPTQPAAVVVASLFGQLFNLFAGTFVPGNLMSPRVLFLYYMSPIRWAQEGIFSTQFFHDQTPFCYPNGLETKVFFMENDFRKPTCETGSNLYTPCSGQLLCCQIGDVGTTVGQYVLRGDDNVRPFLGGDNGYLYEWRFYDFAYMIAFAAFSLGIGILASMKINYKKT